VAATVFALLLAACDLQSAPSETEPGAEGEWNVVGSFDWSLPDRFGLDLNEDGRIDVPNTLEYVLNLEAGACAAGCPDVTPEFTVVLDASEVALIDTLGVPTKIDSYRWTVSDGEAVVLAESTDSSQAVVQLPEGIYEVQLELAKDSQTWLLERTVRVEDLLLVSIGDSYAAGEGNPEVPGDPPLWADAGTTSDSSEALGHELAHRSGLAGAAQAALAIERADSRSSVTFVFLAASGASIETGMLEESDPKRAADGTRQVLRPQVDELADLMGCTPDGRASCLRTIDALHISAGGNDIGFSFTLGSLIALDPLLVVSPIYGNLRDNLFSDIEGEIEQLPALFQSLADALAQLDISRVYLTAYPRSTRYEDGGRVLTCDEVGGDLLPGLEVDQQEIEEVERRLHEPLNNALAAIADEQEWTYVDSHVGPFDSHGYCGSDPYLIGPYEGNPFPEMMAPHPDAGVRWFRQAAESAALQGGGGLFRPERLATSGTLHPNEYGQLAYGQALLRALGY
jgi:hypothetical protein